MAIKKYDGKPIPNDDEGQGNQDFWGVSPDSPTWRAYVKGQLLDLAENWDETTGDAALAGDKGLAIVDSLKFGTLQTGATDHGELTGLEDDDHPQYLTESRGNALYPPISHTHRVLADYVSFADGIAENIGGDQWIWFNFNNKTGFLAGTITNNQYQIGKSGWYHLAGRVTVYSWVECQFTGSLYLNGNQWVPSIGYLHVGLWNTLTIGPMLTFLFQGDLINVRGYWHNTRNDNGFIRQNPYSNLCIIQLEP